MWDHVFVGNGVITNLSLCWQLATWEGTNELDVRAGTS